MVLELSVLAQQQQKNNHLKVSSLHQFGGVFGVLCIQYVSCGVYCDSTATSGWFYMPVQSTFKIKVSKHHSLPCYCKTVYLVNIF